MLLCTCFMHAEKSVASHSTFSRNNYHMYVRVAQSCYSVTAAVDAHVVMRSVPGRSSCALRWLHRDSQVPSAPAGQHPDFPSSSARAGTRYPKPFSVQARVNAQNLSCPTRQVHRSLCPDVVPGLPPGWEWGPGPAPTCPALGAPQKTTRWPKAGLSSSATRASQPSWSVDPCR